MIADAKKLKHIQRTGVGYENVDVQAADAVGVSVSNLPNANGIAVAEHTMMLILALQRKLIEVNAETKNGKWPLWKYRSTSYELDGKVHGFLGFGYIGQATAKRSRAFGTSIVYYDLVRMDASLEAEIGATYMSKDDVIRQADIISVHVPLTKENRNYIGKRELRMMKPNAIIINVARGGVIDEDALFDALKAGTIAGAGIDTWVDEPCPASNPLLSLPNVIATAHLAAGTIDTFRKQVLGAFQNIELAEKTEKPNHIVGNLKGPRKVS